MKSAEGSVDEEQSCQRVVSHEWCEVSLKIDRATVVTMSRRGVRDSPINVLTAYSTDRVRDAPQHTDQHGTSWRSDVPPPCLGGAPHGWVPVNTHGTPVLTSVRRPWVAQPRSRAHASDTRRETRSANSKCADHPNMIVAQGW